jgi:hypothetical protein
MDPRRPASDITKGLTTKSDKVRALAQAGYDRTEISQILGIRYQHVRNVLLQSRFTGGLRRSAEAEREPVEADATPAPREDTSSRGAIAPSLKSRPSTRWSDPIDAPVWFLPIRFTLIFRTDLSLLHAARSFCFLLNCNAQSQRISPFGRRAKFAPRFPPQTYNGMHGRECS